MKFESGQCSDVMHDSNPHTYKLYDALWVILNNIPLFRRSCTARGPDLMPYGRGYYLYPAPLSYEA